MRRKVLSTLLLAGIAAGCAGDRPVAYQRDGVQYGVTEGVFRGRWWSYYERGTSFLAGAFYAEARADFEQALAGRSRDSWRARTYGLHFVEFFPNRELGVVAYHEGKLAEAEQRLRDSLAMIDTARAHHYLDLVKKAKLADGSVQDTSEPEIDTSVAQATIISERALPFEVAASDDVGVEEVTVNGEEMPQRGSAEEVTFEKEVVLEEGTHKVEVVAKDLAEKEVKKEVEVTVDLTGPMIGVFAPIEPTVTPDGTVILEGATVDKNGVVAVEVGTQVLAESPGTPRLEFNSELPLSNGENVFVLAARDIAGNETRSAVKVFKGDPDSLEAKLWLMKQKYPDGVMVADASLNAVQTMMAISATPAESEIRLKSPREDRPYRHNRTLRVAGEVVLPTRIAALSINGEDIGELTGAPKESFNKRLPLDASLTSDQVSVTVHAKDESGTVLERTLTVDVRPVELNTRESRMPVAVLAFNGRDVESAQSEMLRLSAESALVSQGRFRTLDRTTLQEVLTEQQLSTALSSPDEAIALGRLTAAQVFLVADIFPHDQAGLEIKARVVDTATTDLVANLDVFIEDRGDRAQIEKASKNLAAQLAALYPRLSGEVLDARGNTLLLNWTDEDGLRQGASVLLVKEEEPWIDEDTGEVLAPGEFVPVGRAAVDSVSGSSTRATTVTGDEQEGVPVEKGMPAITM